MRAVVYHGPGNKAWEEVRTPSLIDDTDAIVRVDAVTICGTDLHILKGDVPAVTPGRILGHEAVGTIESGSSPRRRSTAPKRSTCESRSPTRRPTSSPQGGATNSCCARGHPSDRV
jgi:threonine dehydrogenase-like Zn-dependent dehydrogenase